MPCRLHWQRPVLPAVHSQLPWPAPYPLLGLARGMSTARTPSVHRYSLGYGGALQKCRGCTDGAAQRVGRVQPDGGKSHFLPSRMYPFHEGFKPIRVDCPQFVPVAVVWKVTRNSAWKTDVCLPLCQDTTGLGGGLCNTWSFIIATSSLTKRLCSCVYSITYNFTNKIIIVPLLQHIIYCFTNCIVFWRVRITTLLFHCSPSSNLITCQHRSACNSAQPSNGHGQNAHTPVRFVQEGGEQVNWQCWKEIK